MRRIANTFLAIYVQNIYTLDIVDFGRFILENSLAQNFDYRNHKKK